MRVTVALNSDAAEKARRTGETPDLGRLVSGEEVTVLKVFGRGRMASVETTQEGFDDLQRRLEGLCVITPTVAAEPF